MATYVFESMSATDAANYTSSDELIFLSAAVSNMGVTDTPGTSTPLQTTAESITLTDNNGHTLIFNAAELAGGSQAGEFNFVNGDQLLISDSSGDTFTGLAAPSHHEAYYGFGGNDSITGVTGVSDTINGGEGNDTVTGVSATSATESDYLFGGNGADSITGGSGNDHIYGNQLSTTQGAADGGDAIDAGDGNDYVNGNSGDDTILGNDGNDRLYGGNGSDSVDGGVGNDYLQGNKGNDTLIGNDGDDTVHGGADNDSLTGGNGTDQLFGDLGNDTVVGGAGYDWLSGGAGNDTFTFAAGDDGVGNLTTASTAASHGVVDVISDFTHAADKLSLGFTVAAVDTSATTFASVDDAYTYAKTLITANHDHAASLQVGADTYLFYDAAGTASTVDAVVKLSAFTASTLTTSDFA